MRKPIEWLSTNLKHCEIYWNLPLGFVFRLNASTCEDWNGLVATGRRCPGGGAKGYDASHWRQTAEFPILTTGKDGASAVLVEVGCAKKVITSTPLIVMGDFMDRSELLFEGNCSDTVLVRARLPGVKPWERHNCREWDGQPPFTAWK